MVHEQDHIYTVERKTATKSDFQCQDRACKGKFTLQNQSIKIRNIDQLSSMPN